jgi:hypothetical protein
MLCHALGHFGAPVTQAAATAAELVPRWPPE